MKEKNLQFWSFSWQRGLPSWCWSQEQGKTGQWSQVWVLPNKWHHLLASSPSWGCSVNTPEIGQITISSDIGLKVKSLLCYDTAWVEWWHGCHRCSSWWRWLSWYWLHLLHLDPDNICWLIPGKHLLHVPKIFREFKIM